MMIQATELGSFSTIMVVHTSILKETQILENKIKRNKRQQMRDHTLTVNQLYLHVTGQYMAHNQFTISASVSPIYLPSTHITDIKQLQTVFS